MRWLFGNWSDAAEQKLWRVLIVLFVLYIAFQVVRSIGTTRGWW